MMPRFFGKPLFYLFDCPVMRFFFSPHCFYTCISVPLRAGPATVGAPTFNGILSVQYLHRPVREMP